MAVRWKIGVMIFGEKQNISESYTDSKYMTSEGFLSLSKSHNFSDLHAMGTREIE